jgi:hypothetical protein
MQLLVKVFDMLQKRCIIPTGTSVHNQCCNLENLRNSFSQLFKHHNGAHDGILHYFSCLLLVSSLWIFTCIDFGGRW